MSGYYDQEQDTDFFNIMLTDKPSEAKKKKKGYF